jgi:hypothetical protein
LRTLLRLLASMVLGFLGTLVVMYTAYPLVSIVGEPGSGATMVVNARLFWGVWFMVGALCFWRSEPSKGQSSPRSTYTVSTLSQAGIVDAV